MTLLSLSVPATLWYLRQTLFHSSQAQRWKRPPTLEKTSNAGKDLQRWKRLPTLETAPTTEIDYLPLKTTPTAENDSHRRKRHSKLETALTTENDTALNQHRPMETRTHDWWICWRVYLRAVFGVEGLLAGLLEGLFESHFQRI
jgi:hypothetical protein